MKSFYLNIASLTLIFSSYCFASYEQGMKYVQQARWHDAEQKFRPEAESGNPNAMYWLGRSLEFQDFQKGLTAGEWFYKSAELGNPWAMTSLRDKTNCEFFGWPCKRTNWSEKRLEIWRDMAAKGEGLAEYALATYDLGWRGYIPFIRKHEKIRRLTKALVMGEGSAAIKLNSVLLGNYGFDTAPQHLREESVKYLLIAAENGYAPAMTVLSGYSDIIGYEVTKNWLYKAIELGYPNAAFLLMSDYDDGSGVFTKDEEKSYYYSKVLTTWGGRFSRSSYISLSGGDIGDDLTQEKKLELDKKAEEWLSTHTVNHFYNEVNLF